MAELAYAETSSEYATTEESGPQFREVALLRRDYEEFVEIKGSELQERKLSRHYYHCDQWTPKQLKTLRARGQNPITKNRLARKIDGIVGVLSRMRSDPKALPRTVKEEQRGGSDIATACMRYVLDNVDWATLRQDCLLNAQVDGIAGVELELEESGLGDNDSDLNLPLVEPDTFFYDPKSVKRDFSDARYMGVAKTVDLGTAIEMFPHKAAELKEIASRGGGTDQFMLLNDREKLWANSTAKRLPLVDHWYRQDGQWLWCVYAGEVLIDQGVSPFRDDRRKSIPKFLMFAYAVDHDGDRYSAVRRLKSPQDEVNHMSSKRLHLIGAKTLEITDGAVKNVEVARREAARADGVIVRAPGDSHFFKIHDRTNDFAAVSRMLDDSLADIENTGPNPALVGTGVQNKSGRAINLLQQAGVAELGPFIASYENWEMRVFRTVWTTVCQHWTANRLVRVTDDDDLVQFIEVNGIGMDEVGNPALINALGELDVDIKIDRGPNVATVMADAYENLLAVVGNGIPIPPQALIELLPGIPSDLKKKLLQMMAPKPDPEQEAAKRVALASEAAKVEKTRAETGKIKAETGKTRADTFGSTANAVERLSRSPIAAPNMGGVSMNGFDPHPAMGPEVPQLPAPPPYMAPPRAPLQQSLPF